MRLLKGKEEINGNTLTERFNPWLLFFIFFNIILLISLVNAELNIKIGNEESFEGNVSLKSFMGGFVPYLGALYNVNLGIYNITADWGYMKINWSSIQNIPAGFQSKAGGGPYLYNNSNTIYLNETELNATISNLDTNTHAGTSGPYLYNDSTTIYFNSTLLNLTINQTLDDFSISFNQTRTVCKEGSCDYNTIQAAINSITDASSSRRYVVLVYPGVYTETVVGKDWVSLKGMGTFEEAEIKGSTGPLYAFPDNGGGVQNFKFTLTPTTNNQEVIDIPASRTQDRAAIINNKINVTFSTLNIRAIVFDINGGNIRYENNIIVYNATGSSTINARTHTIFDADGVTTVDVINNKIDIDFSDVNDNVNVYDDGTVTGADTHIIENIIYVTSNNATFGGIVRAINYVGTIEDLYLISNHIELTSSGTGTSQAFRTNSAGGGATIKSIGNNIQVLNFTNNYWASVAAGDNITSHFDTIEADGGWIGAGGMDYVSSFEPGYLSLTGNLTVKNISADFGNFTDLYVSNSTLRIGNVTISSRVVNNRTYLNIPGTYINTTAFIGDGGFLTNISFEGGNITTNGSINAAVFNGGDFYGELAVFDNITADNLTAELILVQNITGNNATFLIILVNNLTADNVTADNFYGGNFTGDWGFMKINWSDIQNIPAGFINTEKAGGGPYLYNDSISISLNGTILNQTINQSILSQTNGTFVPYVNGINNLVLTGYNITAEFLFGIVNWSQIANVPTFLTGLTNNPYLYLNGTRVGFNETKLNATISDLNVDTDTHVNASGPYLYNNTNTIFFNETRLNATIEDLAVVGPYNQTVRVVVSGGAGTNTTATIQYEINEIIVEPPGSSPYRFRAAEYVAGTIIDEDRQAHVGTWDIFKSYLIDGKTVQSNVTGADGVYNVTIKYLGQFE